MKTVSMKVRYSSGAYVAKCGKVKASSTSSQEFAALACAQKCFPGAKVVTVVCTLPALVIDRPSFWEGTAE